MCSLRDARAHPRSDVAEMISRHKISEDGENAAPGLLLTRRRLPSGRPKKTDVEIYEKINTIPKSPGTRRGAIRV